jgi:membrane peptidoglycan carboxypeptidase
MTYGASAEEMAAAYATINNDGIYRKASCVRQITDSQDNVVYENGMSGKQVYTSNASRMMTDMLGTVMESGTGKNYCLSQMPCAGKTGTTNDNKDGWFVGYTYYYTTSVWVGYDMPRSEEKLKGGTYPAKIWHDYMEQIHDGLALIDFKPYAEYDEDYDRLQDMVGEDETEDEPEDEPEVEDEPDEEEKPDETQTPEPVPEEPVPEESSSGDAGR